MEAACKRVGGWDEAVTVLLGRGREVADESMARPWRRICGIAIGMEGPTLPLKLFQGHVCFLQIAYRIARTCQPPFHPIAASAWALALPE